MALDGTISGLKSSLATLLVRTDMTDTQLNDYIATAEAQMARRFVARHKQGMSIPRRITQRSDATFNVGDEYIAVPSDYVGAIALELTAAPPIELKYISELDIRREKRAARWTNCPPRFYTVVGSQLQIYPVADISYTAELTYWLRFPSLSNTNTSNWISTSHPDAYLYGMALAASPWLLIDPDREAGFAQRFQAAVDDICESDPLPSNQVALRADCAITRNRYSTPYTTTTNT